MIAHAGVFADEATERTEDTEQALPRRHERDLLRILRQPVAMIASDGEVPVFGRANPHPRSYGTFARELGV